MWWPVFLCGAQTHARDHSAAVTFAAPGRLKEGDTQGSSFRAQADLMKPGQSRNRAGQASGVAPILFCMVLSLAACRDTTAPVAGANAALIGPSFSSVPVVWVVGEARAGKPFEVQINTFGLNSCWAKDRTDVQPGALVIITPYNRSGGQGTACFEAVSRIEHVVTLSYPTPGEKQVIIRGRDFDTRAPLHLPVTLVVKP
jgi:hypothetical protein